MLVVQDLEDSIVDESVYEEEDPLRFAEARTGDHLCCPFQCDSCSFWNIRGRGPIYGNEEDNLTLLCIRRAILDSFWARERSTVVYNNRQVVKYLECCDLLGDLTPLPPKGPWDSGDTFGLRLALTLLLRSLDKGNYTKNVQFETVRKVRSAFSNYIHASYGGIESSFIADEGRVQAVTNAASNCLWFRRFMQGMHKRMGDVWIPDRAVTIGEVLAGFKILEEDWKQLVQIGDLKGMESVVLTAVMLIAGFFGGLRGEEVTRMDIGLIRKYWNEATSAEDSPHVPMMLQGRFKKETGDKVFCQPLAVKSHSGVEILKWFSRNIFVMERRGVIEGPMFRVIRKSGLIGRATVGDIDKLFLRLWNRIQEREPKLLPASVKVDDEYSISRSARRGATAHAQNCQVPQTVIEANNRWRKYQRSRGMTPSMGMMERYSDAKASVPTLIRFSQSM